MKITDYKITTHFGEIDRVHKQPHSGLDLNCKTGTKIYSRDSGIINLTVDKYLGNTVRLRLDDGRIIVYGHLSKINVTHGQRVGAGEYLADTGGAVGSKNSGVTTGEHLHVSEYSFNGKTLIDPYNYLFNHDILQQDNYSDLLPPIILIILLFIIWKFRKIFACTIAIILTILTIFIAS